MPRPFAPPGRRRPPLILVPGVRPSQQRRLHSHPENRRQVHFKQIPQAHLQSPMLFRRGLFTGFLSALPPARPATHCAPPSAARRTDALPAVAQQRGRNSDSLLSTRRSHSIRQRPSIALCKQKYDRLKACGKTHGQALRCVGDRLLKVLCKMLQNNTLNEPKPPETVTTARNTLMSPANSMEKLFFT